MGTTDTDLEELEAQARRIPFMILVKRLLRLVPSTAGVGGHGVASEETIRFTHNASPVFHSGDVSSLRFTERDGRTLARVTTTFLGLVGSVSPLAHFFTDDLLDEEAEDDHSLRDFYDLFHHRLVALLYRARLRATPAAELRLDGADRTTARSLAGSGLAPTGDSPLSRRQWLAVARVLGRRPRTRAALEAALAVALPPMSVRLVDFLPRSTRAHGGDLPRFGESLVLRSGTRGWRQGGHHAERVRLVVGPVGARGLRALLPGGDDFAKLRAVVRATLGGRLDAELEIEIACGEEPRARMGFRYGARLGRNTLALRAGSARNMRVRLPLTDGAADGRAVFLVSRSSP